MKIEISKKRLIALCVMGGVLWAALVFRLVNIQIVHGREYADIARRQSTGKMDISAERGIIYDRTGKPLAINIMKNALFAQPADQNEIKKIYAYLDRLYHKPSGYFKNRSPLTVNKFGWIDRRLPDDLAERIMKDTIPGLYIKQELSREYPYLDVGGQILGFTDIDGKGISGLEYSYDSLLAGHPGQMEYLRDGQRTTYRLREVPLIQPTPGKSMTLTIDWYFQEIVEEEIKAGVEEHKALEGTAIFLDCQTGEILAAADYVAGGQNDDVKLRAISNVFEPGSVFKVFTAAGVLDANLANPSDRVFCENGAWKVGPRVLHDDHSCGWLTFQEAIEKSSNIGTAKIALRLGGKRLYENARKFGFGQRYFIGLPGEQAGQIGKPVTDKWSDFNTAALAMGHSVSVTALQLAAGVAAVANGGSLYRPYMIESISDASGKPLKKTNKELIATVMKPQTAATLREFLIGVVERGTAPKVKSDIIRIAGKTGTAQVPDLVSGGYKANKYVASFLGMFPANGPKIVGVVVLNQPEPIHYGGYTSGPIFRKIAERYTIANAEKMKPSKKLIAQETESALNGIPDFVDREVSLAKEVASRNGIKLVSNLEKGIIIWQYPPAGRKAPGNSSVVVAVQNDSADIAVMADFSRMNLRAAMAMLDFLNVPFEVDGSGIVQSQEPPPGTIIDKNFKCRLVCGNELKDEDTTEELD